MLFRIMSFVKIDAFHNVQYVEKTFFFNLKLRKTHCITPNTQNYVFFVSSYDPFKLDANAPVTIMFGLVPVMSVISSN